ncbi:LacI family transcriptional regulator [Lacticaseibacillus paracasei]|uniref:ribose utilization transcriptional repressor RbsR n=1 Tax=Lacticaseibacillus paracasei TaxID=1597 RepID=UPI00272D75E2|nr:LacI family DNA-binding transcriptional regulator [Lacticaseibacillus paracasei]WKZ96481.1 LacI family transcriptional regulator [Lacticaseibacillus paracasei]
MKKKISITDVAKETGLSVTTVSQILNGKGERFSEKSRKRVLAAKKALGYEPDFFALGLVGKRGNSIGVVIPDIMNPFFASFVVSVEKAAIPQGLFPQIFSINGFHENVDYFIRQFLGGTQRGLILAAPEASQEIVQKVEDQLHLPMVFMDQATTLTSGDSIRIDDFHAGFLVADHLIKRGHRRIALVLPEPLTFNLRDRLAGYQHAFDSHNFALDPQLIFRATFDPEGGRQAVDQIVKTDATAIIAINDDVASGVYRGLYEHHKRIPEDYAVVGFDDVSQARFMTPGLTTIAQPIDELGQRAIDMLLAQMAGDHQDRNVIELPVKLIERGSTKRI